jgi:nuclear GTP-binding protein
MDVEYDIEAKPPILNISTNEVPSELMDNDVDQNQDTKSTSLGQNSRRAYLKDLRKVIDSADVILHVLDARDPLGTKSSTIEEMVLSSTNKKLILILNKADLVPREVLIEWLTYLRKFHPTLPFKCNTQVQKGNLGVVGGKVNKQQESVLSTNRAVGTEELIGLLKNYARSGDTKTIISVGCVGFPNVGKSSLINSLLRSRALGVSSTPGFTKQTQEVILDKTIRLIDSPGIVFADGNSAATTLRNCIHVETLEDVISPIQAILDRCPPQYLMQLYGIPSFPADDANSFLSLIARLTGKLKKGGIPNIDAAARTVLHDWNEGKIRYYMKPPISLDLKTSKHETILLSQYSDELDIDALNEEDIRVINQIEALIDNDISVGSFIPLSEDDIHFDRMQKAKKETFVNPTVLNNEVVLKLSKKTLSARLNDGDQKNGQDNRTTAGSVLSGSTRDGVLSRKTAMQYEEEEPSIDSRKLQKLARKKQLKDNRRLGSATIGSSKMSNKSSDDYDFNQDFHR